MDLNPILYNAVMTAAFETTHQTLKSIVTGENQLIMKKKLFWNDTEIDLPWCWCLCLYYDVVGSAMKERKKKFPGKGGYKVKNDGF